MRIKLQSHPPSPLNSRSRSASGASKSSDTQTRPCHWPPSRGPLCGRYGTSLARGSPARPMTISSPAAPADQAGKMCLRVVYVRDLHRRILIGLSLAQSARLRKGFRAAPADMPFPPPGFRGAADTPHNPQPDQVTAGPNPWGLDRVILSSGVFPMRRAGQSVSWLAGWPSSGIACLLTVCQDSRPSCWPAIMIACLPYGLPYGLQAGKKARFPDDLLSCWLACPTESLLADLLAVLLSCWHAILSHRTRTARRS